MSENGNRMVSGMRASLEEMWSALDSLFEEMSPVDWQLPHGPDWTFADLPYHLSYIDRLCVARPIELGEDLPAAERFQFCTINELNAWNQSNIDARPEGQPVEKSLEQMCDSRDFVQRVTANLTDADLAKPAWFPLLSMRGFRPAQVALGFCVGHTWGHMEEARVRIGHPGTMVNPQLTHAMLDGNIPGTTLFLDASRAREQNFSFALNITGPGGGTWAFQATDEGWQVSETESADTDLVLSQNLDAYIKTRFFINDMASLIESGDIEVDDEKALSFYSHLFVIPDFDMEFPRLP